MDTILNEIHGLSHFLVGDLSLIDIGCPWMTLGSILAIEKFIHPEHKVLELGAGGSTIFFSRRCAEVRSYETSEEWTLKVKEKLPNVSTISWVVGDFDMLLSEIQKEPPEYYDWIIGDISSSYRFRLEMINASIRSLRKGGFLVIDNYAQRCIDKFDYSGWKFLTFDAFGYSGKGTRICWR